MLLFHDSKVLICQKKCFFSTFEPDIAYIMIQRCLYVQKMYFFFAAFEPRHCIYHASSISTELSSWWRVSKMFKTSNNIISYMRFLFLLFSNSNIILVIEDEASATKMIRQYHSCHPYPFSPYLPLRFVVIDPVSRCCHCRADTSNTSQRSIYETIKITYTNQ